MQNIVIRKAVLFGVLFLFGYSVFSQQGIGTNNPETSSVLEIKSNSLGVLIPRLTNSQMLNIALPADGLMVYCLDCSSLGIYTFNSSTDQFLLNGPNNELEATVPGISTVSSTITKYGKISTEVKITDTQGLLVTEKGIVYSSTNTSPILSNSTSVINYDALVNGTFSSETNGLLSETIYHIRSFATNIHGTSYGEVSTHTTPSAFVITIEPNGEFKFPLEIDESGYDLAIYWGDGTENKLSGSPRNSPEKYVHTYTDTETKTITVHGDIGPFRLYHLSQMQKNSILEISSWGDAKIGFSNVFSGATNLTTLPAAPVITSNNFTGMFYGCTALDINLSSWNVSAVTNFTDTFKQATSFNNGGEQLNWNTSSATIMSSMFYQAAAFNQDISNWDVTNVTRMDNMFSSALAFNNGGVALDWDYGFGSNANMASMFFGATAFNQAIVNWDTSNVTNMRAMFYSAAAFNQPIVDWNTSNVTDMGFMFFGTNTFNQDISNWNLQNVVNASHMFRGNTAFDNGGEPLDWDNGFGINCDLNFMFYQATAFNQDISDWNLSNASQLQNMFYQNSTFDNGGVALNWDDGFANNANMSNMFAYSRAFNQDISNWDLSNVTNMNSTFRDASAFNNGGEPLDWDDGFGTDANLTSMFNNADAFNQDVSSWDLSNASQLQNMFSQSSAFDNGGVALNWDDGFANNANISGMFFGATAFNQPIGTWVTSNVTNMSQLFFGATAFNQPIGNWNTSSVTNMSSMFQLAAAFNQPIGTWNTTSVTGMNQMFSSATVFDQNINNWNIDKVTSMQRMFSGATNFNGELPTNRSSGVIPVLTNMGYMFYNAPAFNQDVSVLNVTNVTYMQHAFTNARAFNNADVPLNWGSETAKITNWNNAFQGAIAFNNSGVEGWDMSSVTTMYDMFNGAEAFNQIIFSWNVSNVTNMNNMFLNADAFNQNISYWCVTNISSEPYRFSTSSPLTGINKPVWGTCPVMPVANDDFGNPYLSRASNGIIEAANSTVAGVSYLLDGEIYIVVDDAGLTAAIGANNTNNIVTTKITDMSNLFQGNTTFNLDISNWDTSNVTNMREMFNGATAFNQDIGSWDVSSVTNMYGLFNQANSFNQNLSNWNTISVTNMGYMFAANPVFNNNGAPLTFNTSSVTYMQSMFYGTDTFNQDISQQDVIVNGATYTAWDTSNVTNMRTMFWKAAAFNQNIGDWNTSSVTTMHWMFREAVAFNQNLSNWNVGLVTDCFEFLSMVSGWTEVKPVFTECNPD